MSDPVATILPGLILMPSAQALALRALRLYDDMELFDRFYPTLSPLLASFGGLADGVVSGTVAVFSTPAARRVTLFDHRTLRPVVSTWSDPETGAYTFTGLARSCKYLVICDDYAQTYNAAIADWVSPEVVN